MTKTVTLTLEQARTALDCVYASVRVSRDAIKRGNFEVDIEDVAQLTFYLRRAELAERLLTAINNAMKDN